MFNKIAEGFVYKAPKGGKVACGPRAAICADGRIVCSYMVQTQISQNDFVPMVAYSENGETWSGAKPIWPQWVGEKSPFVSVRNTPDGAVSVAGMFFEIDGEGEMFWSNEANGMKENKLVWGMSYDGVNFSEPNVVDLAYYASSEQPGGMLVKKDGEMIMIYAPYDTIKKKHDVVTNKLIKMTSKDNGKTFEAGIIGSVEGDVHFAESWIIELGNGKIVVSSWMPDSKDAPDVYFLSGDGGESFTQPIDMKIGGQSTALEPYGDDMVLVSYNQRASGTVGVWLALGKPGEQSFNLLANEPVWEAKLKTRSNKSEDFDNWTDYAFGEPHVKVLPDGNLLVVFWCLQPDECGIKYVKLAMQEE
ncbi:MAG: exo-alpha-sialidase [Clostridia bacterium]|jgi:hypothetical protein|nr:exo-alpha-sialidase [Clostridia bacterium]